MGSPDVARYYHPVKNPRHSDLLKNSGRIQLLKDKKRAGSFAGPFPCPIGIRFYAAASTTASGPAGLVSDPAFNCGNATASTSSMRLA